MRYSIEEARMDAYVLFLLLLTSDELMDPANSTALDGYAQRLYRLYISASNSKQPRNREELALLRYET